MACKVSLQSLLATLIAISVANNGNGSAQVAGRCIAYVRPATRIPSALLHVVPMPAWEQRQLGELVTTTIGGGTPSTSNPAYWDGEIPWIQSSNVLEDTLFDVDIPKAITQKGLEESAAQIVPENSIAVVTHVGVGKLIYLPFQYSTSQDFISLCGLKGDARYTCYALWKRLQEDLHIVQGSAIKGITKEDLLEKNLPMPSVEEQAQIGVLFSQLDNLITLHQRKYDKLVIFKKTMLEKMFPKDGESVPEIRFAGFTDPWEQRELVDIAEIVGGGTPDTNNSNYWDGDIDWYAPAELGNNIYAESSTRKITQAGFDSCSTKMLPADKTILFTSRAGIGNTAILRHSACTNQGFQSLVIGDADVYFVYSMSERIKKWAEEKASGSTFLEISGRQLETMPVNLPSLVEQQAIGSFFSHLDDLITLHQRKLELLQNIKKSLLDKMFV